MEAFLSLEIVTPEKVIFTGKIISVNVPGASGSFSILKQHAPIVAELKNGKIQVLDENNKDFTFDCKSGVVECVNNNVAILIES
jgi:F-type H+-transporting ATPase subunit epsilon